jgi:drug/metabolite transporter (DMT)-like permease
MWIFFALASAFFAATNRTLIKQAGSCASNSAIVFSRSAFGAVLAVTFLPLASIPPVSLEFLLYLAGACFADVLAILSLSQALRYSPMVQVVPLLSFTPAFLLVTGLLFLGEVPSLQGVVGVMVTVSGSYLLGKTRAGMKLWEPLYMLWKDPGARFMLLAAGLMAFAGPLFKKAVLSTTPYFAVCASLPLSTLLLMILHLCRGRQLHGLFPKRENLGIMVALGFGVFGVALTANLAFKYGLVSYVVSMKRLSIIISLFMGAVIFHEHGFKKHLVPAAVMVGGACLIAFS